MLALALTVALAAVPGQGGAAREDSPVVTAPAPEGASAPEPQALDGPAQVRALCGALTPVDRLRPRGDGVERGRAEIEHARRREGALNGRYRLAVPGDRLRFETYDAEERQLRLSDRALLRGAGGALQTWAAHDAALPVEADEATARRILEAAKRRTLVLVLTFTLPDDEDEATCSHVAGGRVYTLEVEPFAWRYQEGDEVLARGGEGGDRPLVTAAQGARPRVDVAEPVGGGRGVRDAVQARRKDLEGCYRRALEGNPGLDGVVVAEVDARGVRLAADSVQDEAMAECVRGVLARASLPRAGGERAAIPIRFSLEPPAAASGTGGGR